MKHGFRRFFPPYTACEHTCGNIIRSFTLLGKIWKQRSRNWKIKFQNYGSLIFKTRPKLCYFTLISRFYCMQKLFLGNTSSIWIWIYDREKRRYNSNQIYVLPLKAIKHNKTTLNGHIRPYKPIWDHKWPYKAMLSRKRTLIAVKCDKKKIKELFCAFLYDFRDHFLFLL